MSNYRHKETGEVKSQGQWRAEYPNTSLPKVWTASTLEFLKLDEVLASPRPEYDPTTHSVSLNGAKLEDGNWVQNWVVEEFSESVKAEKKAEATAKAEASVRSRRDRLLRQTDWTALTDVTMSPEMAAYRQALRDITDHSSFPDLEESEWPTKPGE